MTGRTKCNVCNTEITRGIMERIIFENEETGRSVHYIICPDCARDIMKHVTMMQYGICASSMLKVEDNLEYMRTKDIR